jgi:excisionase family DNA binding protein
MSDKLLFTVPEAAQVLSLGDSKTWELIAAGELESVRIGRARRVPRDALDRYVESLRTNDSDIVRVNGNGP